MLLSNMMASRPDLGKHAHYSAQPVLESCIKILDDTDL